MPGDWGLDLARRYLSSEALALFRAMPRYDQRHATGVARTLYAQGQRDADLLVAALLHDAGKTVPPPDLESPGRGPKSVRLWHRVAVVLMRAFSPGLLSALAGDGLQSWRRPFYVQTHHAALGAELARNIGCSPRTVFLIQHHEDASGRDDDPLLSVLQAADNVN
jgi:hypothetical protein